MEVFIDRMVDGLGAAGWVIGLLFGLGMALLVVGTIGYVATRALAASNKDNEEEL